MRSRAASMSSVSIFSLPFLAAKMAASFMRFSSEAPLKPVVLLATASRSTSPMGLPLTYTSKMARRAGRSGRLMATRLSKRPGRRRASSKMSARLVAAITTTPWLPENPSISASSWLSVCSLSSFCGMKPPEDRARPMESISSMKMMQGATFLAFSNKSRTRLAPIPTNTSTKLDPDCEKKGTPASPATALAIRVLPVPGGPSMMTPLGILAPSLVNCWGFLRKVTTSPSSVLASS
mmetsp:Transcript_31725/g.78614  ORF Transcript_31725/g.78614 Transcript_31725/m.78614 type:complete len:236 (+) Transcript_31725:1524-2231(+)